MGATTCALWWGVMSENTSDGESNSTKYCGDNVIIVPRNRRSESHLIPICVWRMDILTAWLVLWWSHWQEVLHTRTVKRLVMPPGWLGKASFASSPRRPNGALNLCGILGNIPQDQPVSQIKCRSLALATGSGNECCHRRDAHPAWAESALSTISVTPIADGSLQLFFDNLWLGTLGDEMICIPLWG